MSFDVFAYLRQAKEQEQSDRWKLAFTGVCPHCENKRGHRYDDLETGEIEWVWCHFCHSEEELEAKERNA